MSCSFFCLRCQPTDGLFSEVDPSEKGEGFRWVSHHPEFIPDATHLFVGICNNLEAEKGIVITTESRLEVYGFVCCRRFEIVMAYRFHR